MSNGGSLPIVIGIAGGTGAGKTTVARHLSERYRSLGAAVLDEDSYYLDRSHLEAAERERVNYDEPAAIDHHLLLCHLETLIRGADIEKPRYCFAAHTRTGETDRVPAASIVIVEGLFTLWHAGIRRLLTLKVYVETDTDVRFIRRLRRDLAERGRTVDSIVAQYLETVRPMHQNYIEPVKQLADLVLDGSAQSCAELDARTDALVHGLYQFGAANSGRTSTTPARIAQLATKFIS